MAQAERLFASLTEQAERRRNGPWREPIPAPAETATAPAEIAPPPPVAIPHPEIELRPVTEPEVLELARATLATTDRIAEVVNLLASQANATAADLVALGSGVEQALAAANDRLAFLERILLDSDSPLADPADEAMAQLRRTLRRSDDGSMGSGG